MRRKFNGLRARILNLIVDEEAKRIDVNCLKNVLWVKLDGDSASCVYLKEKGEFIYMSKEKTKYYCQYIYKIRHELFHIKHLKMSCLVERLPILRFILRKLIVENPAYKYAESGPVKITAFCRKCPHPSSQKPCTEVITT